MLPRPRPWIRLRKRGRFISYRYTDRHSSNRHYSATTLRVATLPPLHVRPSAGAQQQVQRSVSTVTTKRAAVRVHAQVGSYR